MEKSRSFFTPFRLVTLAILLISIWTYVLKGADFFSVAFLDVGQGDSALVTFEGGQTLLIDGGPDRKILDKLGSRIPFYKNKIDYILLTHPHADHVAGLVWVMKKYQVGQVFMNDTVHTTPEYTEFLKIIREKQIPVTRIQEGLKLRGDNLDAEIIYPSQDFIADNLNNGSAVFSLKYKNSTFLFMGDLEAKGQETLLERHPGIKADVLKIPHHGSTGAIFEELWEKLDPKFAVISVGSNDYGHPSKRVLDFLKNQGVGTFRTDIDKDVIFLDRAGTLVKN